MNDLSLDSKKSLLGQKGLALVMKYLATKKIGCTIPTDVLDPEIDLWMHPNFPDETGTVGSQIKTKVPWIFEKSQSFTSYQWSKYQHLNSLWMICVPAADKYSNKDIWSGNVYHFNPHDVKTNLKSTNGGREMVLIPLSQLSSPTFKITNQKDLDQLKRFATEEE